MTLDEIRVEIDRIDKEMKPLFLKRMECARHVADAKAVTGRDVFVPERELAIIGKRAADVEEAHEEYVAFLRHLMSVSRRFQYGILKEMQDGVIRDVLHRAGLDENQEHRQVKLAFTCQKETSDLNIYLNMVQLNGVPLDQMEVRSENGIQRVKMVLDGNMREEAMRRLVCQLGKEAADFAVIALTA